MLFPIDAQDEPQATLDDLALDLDDAYGLHDLWVATYDSPIGSPYVARIIQLIGRIETLLQEAPCATPSP